MIKIQKANKTLYMQKTVMLGILPFNCEYDKDYKTYKMGCYYFELFY